VYSSCFFSPLLSADFNLLMKLNFHTLYNFCKILTEEADMKDEAIRRHIYIYMCVCVYNFNFNNERNMNLPKIAKSVRRPYVVNSLIVRY
jgi:hypothetical protein